MIKAIIKTMRPRQWTKNVFVLAALVFDRKLPNPSALLFERRLTNIDPLLHSLAGFFLFCLLSSSVYIINDIVDVESDRQHPSKKFRPIAARELSIPVAIAMAVLIIAITFTFSYLLSPNFFLVALTYFISNLAYSTWLKHIPLLDVLILALGFVLRVAAGVTVIQVERFSPWLYVVTTLFALYIGFGKRRAEIILLGEKANSHRKVLMGYTIPFLDQLITIVSSTTIVAYSLYTFSAPNLPANHSMMLTIPFVLYGIFRYLYLINVQKEGGAPEEIILKDHPLQASVLLYAITVLIIFYSF